MRSKDRAARLSPLIAVALVLAAYGVAEVTVRERREDVLIYRDSAVAGLGFEPVLGASGKLQKVAVALNSLGLRNGEVPPQKPSGVKKRILILGDSVAFGRGVAAEATFAQRWASALGPSYEVINGAVCAYTGQQELTFYETRLRVLKPDHIVMVITPDDLDAAPKALVRWPRLKNFLRERSALARFVMEEASKSRGARASAGLAHAAEAPRRRGGAAVEEDPLVFIDEKVQRPADDLIGRARDLASADKADLTVVLVPRLDRMNVDIMDEERRAALRQAARKAGVAFWDATRLFVGKAVTDFLVTVNDPYLNDAGHAAVAGFLAERSKKDRRL